MNTYSLMYSSEAIDDLICIYNYIANEQSERDSALIQINTIRKQILSLSQLPLRNPLVSWSPWNKLGFRHFLVKNHIVFYIVDEKQLTVYIVRILSSRRDIPSILKGIKEKN